MIRSLLISMMMLMMLMGTCLAEAQPADSPGKDSGKEKQQVLPLHEHSAACEQTSAEPLQIICILDRSGSMRDLAGDTIGGYNSFLDKQKKEPGRAEVTTVLFDNQYEMVVKGVNLADVPALTPAEYYARGTTALLDAVGMTLTEVAGKMAKEGVCPAKRRVVVLIMTDGKENASKEYNKLKVKAMIEKATNDYKWNFVFMGANIDSVAEASSLGISSRHAVDYSADKAGVQTSFARMEAAVNDVRETGSVSEDWKK